MLFLLFERWFCLHEIAICKIELKQSYGMSSISIATLPRMSRDALSALLKSTTGADKLAIVDVRDSGMINDRPSAF